MLLEGGTHALLFAYSRGSVHERGQQPQAEGHPRCVGAGISRTLRCSRTSASGGHLRTTQNFSVPLQLLYNTSFAEHALCRFVEPFNIFAMARMISHYLRMPSAALWPLDMIPLMCDLPPVCRAQECLVPLQQCQCGFHWRLLAGSEMSPAASCLLLSLKSLYHIHTLLPLHFRTARLSSLSASRLGPVDSWRGLWGPMTFELQGGSYAFCLQPPASPKFVNKNHSRLA